MIGQNRTSARRRLAGNRSSRWALMEKFVIPNLDDPTETYLTRWRIIQTPRFALYLHRMDGPDSRPTMHDHPWNFLSVALRGGYIERRLDPRTMQVDESRRVGRVNLMRTHDAHAITTLLRVPTWTLVFVGARRRTWGYWTDIGWGDWLWTAYDKHQHANEFDHAMALRLASEGGDA